MIPEISIIMPVYNSEQYLNEAIVSILNQTFTNFEFIIINDGSTDCSEKIIFSYNDPRIKYIKNTINLGIVDTLNKGIRISLGQYIVRMDSDDISYPNRLKEQFNFMENNPDVVVSGTTVKNFTQNKTVYEKIPCDYKEIKAKLFFQNAIAHPSTILRTNIIKSMPICYDRNYQLAEDYDLWCRISANHKISNINKVLLKYRKHSNSSSLSKSTEQYTIVCKILFREASLLLNRDLTENEKLIHSLHVKKTNSNISFNNIIEWCYLLEHTNNKEHKYDSKYFRRWLANYSILALNSISNKKTFLKNYFNNPYRKSSSYSIRDIFYFYRH